VLQLQVVCNFYLKPFVQSEIFNYYTFSLLQLCRGNFCAVRMECFQYIRAIRFSNPFSQCFASYQQILNRYIYKSLRKIIVILGPMNVINMKTQNNVIGFHDRLNLHGILKFCSKLSSTMLQLQPLFSRNYYIWITLLWYPLQILDGNPVFIVLVLFMSGYQSRYWDSNWHCRLTFHRRLTIFHSTLCSKITWYNVMK
jgi:hypothetical protein